MPIITKTRLFETAAKYPHAEGKVTFWHHVVKSAVWRNLIDTRKSFPHADQVTVRSGRTVTVFNVSNAFRLLTAIHYNKQRIYILKFLTHAEYDRGRWKNQL